MYRPSPTCHERDKFLKIVRFLVRLKNRACPVGVSNGTRVSPRRWAVVSSDPQHRVHRGLTPISAPDTSDTFSTSYHSRHFAERVRGAPLPVELEQHAQHNPFVSEKDTVYHRSRQGPRHHAPQRREHPRYMTRPFPRPVCVGLVENKPDDFRRQAVTQRDDDRETKSRPLSSGVHGVCPCVGIIHVCTYQVYKVEDEFSQHLGFISPLWFYVV
jgi:hypothetical protein